jgi:UDP-4-amino-4,6-dideoxy-N-acetyl-beta-L-altrosamine N-acetyltransferase
MNIKEYRADFNLKDIRFINYSNISKEESEMILNWRNNDKIKKWMYTSHTISAEEHSRFMQAAKNDPKNFYWLAKDKANNYLGVISLNKVDIKNRSTYLGLHGNPEAPVAGSGYKLLEGIIWLAFDVFKLHELKLEVLEDNIQARNLYKKTGFHDEGRINGSILKNGKEQNIIIMGMTNNKGSETDA